MPQIDLRNWGKGRPDTPAESPSGPTKEQFEAAAQRVMQTAPPGLSREDFFTLIDRELAPKVAPQFANVPVDETGKPIEHEPDTYLGGFLKSIKDQVLHATVDNPSLQGAANPKSLGDVMSLAVPSGLENLRIPLRNVIREIGAGIDEAPTLRKVPGSVIGHVSDYLKEAPETTNTRLFNQKPLYEQMKDLPGLAAPEARATMPLRPPQGTFNDLPLYKQMEELTRNPLAAPEMSRGAAPPIRKLGMETPAPVTATSPRLVKSGGDPQSLEDVLANVLNPTSPTRYTGGGMELPPQLETAGEGALKQSGKFGKSGNMGQAGGYTSGRPGITEAQQNELLKKFGGGGGGPELPTRPPGGDVIQPPPSKFPPEGGQGDWHSGAEPGSAEARSAQALHRDTGELDSLYRQKINDPLAALLMSLGIGAGAAGAQR